MLLKVTSNWCKNSIHSLSSYIICVYINNLETLQNIYQLFDLSKNHESLNVFNNIQIMNGPILREVMRPILEEDGFIFAN